MRIALAFCLFAATWLLWSGHYSPLLLGLGLLSCGLVLLLALRTGFFAADVYTLHLGPRLPRFWLWLAKEIVRANWDVARIVLNPRLPISPTIVTLDASRIPAVTRATLANSITLTPGTVSIDVDQGNIEVHCLTRSNADELRAGAMLRRAAALNVRDERS